MSKCACGCGNELEPVSKSGYIKEYIHGHNRRGTTHPNYIPKKRENHYNWKGGRITDKNGYIQIRCEGHPRAYSHGFYVPEHILVMEKHLGRYLEPDENVHHINENRQDNRLINLQLMTRGEHTKHHHLDKPLIKEKRICFNCGSNKTFMRKSRSGGEGLFPFWYILDKEQKQYLCNACYLRRKRKLYGR